MLPIDGTPPVFGSASTGAVDGMSAAEPANQRAIGSVATLLFDDLNLAARPGSTSPAWRVQAVSLPLLRPSRRRIRLQLRCELEAVGAGRARALVVSDTRRAVATVQCREQQPGPNGELPSRRRSVVLTLTLPRSAQVREEVRALVLIEAWSDGGEALVSAESLDCQAL